MRTHKVLVSVALLILPLTRVQADVHIVGSSLQKTVKFSPEMGLVEAMNGVDYLPCSVVQVNRLPAGSKDACSYSVSLADILIRFGSDFPLQDGDVIFTREHIFPCMGDERVFPRLLDEFTELKRKDAPKPENWDARVSRSGGCRYNKTPVPPNAPNTKPKPAAPGPRRPRK